MEYWASGFFIEHGRVGGAEEAFYGLMRGFSENQFPISTYVRQKENLDPEFIKKNLSIKEMRTYPGNRFLAEELLAIHKRNTPKAILFSNYYTPRLRPKSLEKIVTLIPDIQYKMYPEHFKSYKKKWLDHCLTHTFLKADKIITISEFSANQIENHFGSAARAKTIIIPNPVIWSDNVRMSLNNTSKPPVLLSIGAHFPHKNYLTFLKSFAQISKKIPDCQWIILGQLQSELKGHMVKVDLLGAIDELGLNGKVIIKGYVSNEELIDHIEKASLLIHPSKYEGFGLPVVEALGYGLPVLCSKGTSLFEVTCGHANYVDDPMNILEWVDKTIHILNNLEDYQMTNQIINKMKLFYSPSKIALDYALVLRG